MEVVSSDTAAPVPSDALTRHLSFTQRALDTLKPHARGSVEYYDTKTPGLALGVQPTGRKTFYLNYRDARERRESVGEALAQLVKVDAAVAHRISDSPPHRGPLTSRTLHLDPH